MQIRSYYVAHVLVGLAAIGTFAYTPAMKYISTHTIPAGFESFDVQGLPPSCARWRENMPKTRATGPYRRYLAARNRWRSKVEWEFTREELQVIFRDVDIAASQGDWGARALLAAFYRSGLGPLEKNHVLDPAPEKAIEIVRAGVAAGQPWAHYDLAVAYELGYGGVSHNKGIAWAFYLRAAQLGSPDAQLALADAYSDVKRWDAEVGMLTCAFRQGHGPAAYRLGVLSEIEKKFADAIGFYHQGTAMGDDESAAVLMLFFAAKYWNARPKADRDELIAIGLQFDNERSSRYDLISEMLELNPDLRLSRLNDILPLPPQALPQWNCVEDAIEPDGPVAY
jgi:TPR repeat protein